MRSQVSAAEQEVKKADEEVKEAQESKVASWMADSGKKLQLSKERAALETEKLKALEGRKEKEEVLTKKDFVELLQGLRHDLSLDRLDALHSTAAKGSHKIVLKRFEQLLDQSWLAMQLAAAKERSWSSDVLIRAACTADGRSFRSLTGQGCVLLRLTAMQLDRVAPSKR